MRVAGLKTFDVVEGPRTTLERGRLCLLLREHEDQRAWTRWALDLETGETIAVDHGWLLLATMVWEAP